MAVLIGKYNLQKDNPDLPSGPLGQDNKYRGDFINYTDQYALGLTLPLQFGPTTFSQAYDNITQLKANVKNLLLTQPGERLGQPNFGTNLSGLLFEQNDSQLEDRIYTTIDKSIKNWLPQLAIQSIEIKSSDEMKDKNTVEVSIIFSANYSGQNFQVDFKVNA
jgi:phage baseplate assembly protein W